MKAVSVPSRHVWRKLVLGLVAGAISYVLMLWLHGPWEEIIAAALIGSVVGIADLSPARIVVGSTACATGWLLGSMLFGTGCWSLAGCGRVPWGGFRSLQKMVDGNSGDAFGTRSRITG